jgi:hypothetical protein
LGMIGFQVHVASRVAVVRCWVILSQGDGLSMGHPQSL